MLQRRRAPIDREHLMRRAVVVMEGHLLRATHDSGKVGKPSPQCRKNRRCLYMKKGRLWCYPECWNRAGNSRLLSR